MTRLSFILAAGSLAWGQTGAGLSGTLRDATGAGLPGATIIVTNVEKHTVRKTVTDPDGRYAAPALDVGHYEITGAKTGFSSETKTGISLTVGQEAVVDLTLQLGELKQEIRVEETVAPVNLSTQQTS